MQFLIVAYDGKDTGAPGRRMAAREAHLAGARRRKAEGYTVAGGAILDDEGRMIGSAAIVDYPSRAELDAWLKTDPYVTGGVWVDIQVQPFRQAV